MSDRSDVPTLSDEIEDLPVIEQVAELRRMGRRVTDQEIEEALEDEDRAD